MAEKRPTSTKAIKNIIEVATSLEFLPSEKDKELKASFWALERENPTCDPDLLTACRVAEVVNYSNMEKKWAIPGFREWFCNKNEAKQRAERIFNKLLDALDNIASSDDPKAYSAQLAAFKALGEYLGHLGKSNTPPPLGLPTDQKELEALVASMQKRLGVAGD